MVVSVTLDHGGSTSSYASIQDAVDHAASGDTILLAGTFSEQIVVNGKTNLTIKAATAGGATIQAPTTLTQDGGLVTAANVITDEAGRPVFALASVAASTNIQFQNLIFDGQHNSTGVTGSNPQIAGVYYQDSSGGLDHVDVKHIGDPLVGGLPSGAQRGVGVIVDNTSLHAFSVTGGSITDFQKNGMYVKYATLAIDGLTVSGSGPIGTTAQNGLVVYNSTGLIHNSTVNGIGYTGSSAYTAGVLSINNTNLNIQDNHVTGANSNLSAQVVGIWLQGAAGAVVSGNTVASTDTAIEVDNASANANPRLNINASSNVAVTGNTINTVDGADAYFSDASAIDFAGAGSAGNTVSGNTVDLTDISSDITLNFTTLQASDFIYNTGGHNWTVKGVTVANGEVTDSAGHNFFMVGDAHGYATVQAATAASAPGDTILVALPNLAAPVFTAGASATASLSEGQDDDQIVYTAAATDADHDTLVYSLIGGADAALFNIDHATGAVTFKASPSFSSPGDAGADNLYNIVVQASDGLPAHNATQAVAITVTDDPNVTTAPATVTGTTTLDGPGSGSTITGNVVNSGTIDFTKSTPLTFSGTISGTGTLEKQGGGTLTLSGVNTYSGPTNINGGLLVVNGSISNSSVTVGSGATLGGSGTTGSVTLVNGAAFGPGNSPGTINTASLTLTAGALYKQEIGAFTAGQFDVANVTGTVALNGATLNTTLYNGFAPSSGSSALVIINNDGSDAVTGTFAGLAEGASFTLGGLQVKISYVGGTGNDVTLQFVTPSGGGGGGGGGGSGVVVTPPSLGQADTAAGITAGYTNATGVDPTSSKATTATINLADGSVAPNPEYAKANLLVGYIQQFLAGTMSKAQLMDRVVDLSGDTSAVAVQAYQFFTGATPTQAGLSYLVNSTGNPNDLTDAYYAKFNIANRYINFAVNLGTAPGEGASAFATNYGPLSFHDAAVKEYNEIIGNSKATAAGVDVAKALAYIEAQHDYFLKLGGGTEIGAKAAMAGYIMEAGFVGHVGLYYDATKVFLVGAYDGTVTYHTAII